MSILKFKERFTKDIIESTTYIPKHTPEFLKIIFIIIFDLSIYILLILFLFLSVIISVNFLFLALFLLPISIFLARLQIYKLNQVQQNKYIIQLNKPSPLRKLALKAKNYENKEYFIYSQPYENFETLVEPIKIIYISDIHFGSSYSSSSFKKLERVANIINNINSEIFVFGGDLFCSKFNNKAFDFFKLIKKKFKIGVFGNHDTLYLGTKSKYHIPEEFVFKMDEAGVKILVNENYEIKLRDNKIISFGGITDLLSLNFDLNEAFRGSTEGSTKILLSHNPEIVDYIEPTDDISLVLSGHTHWGQIRINDTINLYKHCKYPALYKGLYQHECGTKIHISQGLGVSTIRTKFGVENSIDFLEIYS
jgi:predicted MPP superfamily phosphohydrolase